MASRTIVATALVSVLTATLSATDPPQATADDQSRREAIRHYKSGQELLASEKFEQAADEFSIAIRHDRLFTLAHYFLGQAYVNLRRYTSAIKAYQACVEACREIYAMRQTNRFEAEKRRDDEIRTLRETVALAQRQSAAAAGSGLSARAIQLEQQLEELERARSSIDGPFQPPAEVLLALGSALYHNDQIEQAEFEWRAAIQVNPKFGEAHNNLAVVYMRTGRLEDAMRELSAAEKYGARVNPQFKKDLKSAMARR